MRFPVDDWQFWMVTLACVGAAWLVVRPFLPWRRTKSDGCPGCASGQAAMKSKRTSLTIGRSG